MRTTTVSIQDWVDNNGLYEGRHRYILIGPYFHPVLVLEATLKQGDVWTAHININAVDVHNSVHPTQGAALAKLEDVVPGVVERVKSGWLMMTEKVG